MTIIALNSAVVEAISKSLPSGPGQRTKRIFEFARRLKAIPGLDRSRAALARYIQEWHRRALPKINTKEFAATETAFYTSWINATIPLSDEGAWGWLQDWLTLPEPDWFRHWSFPPRGKKLLRVCMALQEASGAKPFYLSANRAGDVIGTDWKTAHALLKSLVSARVLQIVTHGTRPDRKPTAYRYIGPPRDITSLRVAT
jgi:hypothetical protein